LHSSIVYQFVDRAGQEPRISTDGVP